MTRWHGLRNTIRNQYTAKSQAAVAAFLHLFSMGKKRLVRPKPGYVCVNAAPVLSLRAHGRTHRRDCRQEGTT